MIEVNRKTTIVMIDDGTVNVERLTIEDGEMEKIFETGSGSVGTNKVFYRVTTGAKLMFHWELVGPPDALLVYGADFSDAAASLPIPIYGDFVSITGN